MNTPIMTPENARRLAAHVRTINALHEQVMLDTQRIHDRFPLSDWMEARINSGNAQAMASADTKTPPKETTL